VVLFQHGGAGVIVQRVQIWRVWGPLVLLDQPRTVRCSQSCMHDVHRAVFGAILLEDETLTNCLLNCNANGSHFKHLQEGLISKSVSSYQHQKRLISDIPTFRRKQRPKCSKIVIIFFQGSAATLSRWVGKLIFFVLHIFSV